MNHPQVALGDLARIRTGKLDANASSPNGKYPFFTCAINPLRIDTYSFECECVLVAGNGDLNVKYHNGRFDAYQRTYIVEPISQSLNCRYLYHFLDSYLAELRKLSIGGVIKYIKLGNLTDAQIPLPPLEEQRSIAAILDKANELEALSVKQSKLLEDCEKHLFLEYFGLPFPGKTPWAVAQLSEIGSLERGVSKHRPRNDPSLMNGPYPFIQTGDVAGCRGTITTYSATYSEKGLAQSRLWKKGTLCITIAANIAKTGILGFDACFPDSVVGFQNNNPAIITYVQCWMSFLQSHIEQMAPESAQKNINLEILRGLTVPVPSEEKLENFNSAILLLRRTWKTSICRNGQTRELKRALQSANFSA